MQTAEQDNKAQMHWQLPARQWQHEKLAGHKNNAKLNILEITREIETLTVWYTCIWKGMKSTESCREFHNLTTRSQRSWIEHTQNYDA